MKVSEQSFAPNYKERAAKIVRELAQQQKPLVISQHGKPKAVIQDIQSYKILEETMSFLKTLASESVSE